MPDFKPSAPPDPTEGMEGFRPWVMEQFDQLSLAIPSGKLYKLEIRNAAPDKPRNGMVVYADGVVWNPGSGEGFYGYEAGAWVKF